MAAEFDPYHKWLAIPPEEQPPHHYRLLGLKTFETDPDVIEAAADQRMSHLRTYQVGKHSALSQRLLNEVATAKLCLLNAAKRADYDAKLRELLDRQSAHEDTSGQLKGLQELGALLASELSRPTVKPRRKSANTLVFVTIGGVLALAALAAVLLKSHPKEAGNARVAVGSELKTSSEPGGSAAGRGGVSADSRTASGKPKVEISRPQSADSGQKVASGSVSQPLVSSSQSPQSAIPDPQSKISAPAPLRDSATPRAMVSGSTTALPSSAKPPEPPPTALANPPVSSPQSPAALLPIPSEADKATALRQAQELFRDEYAQAKKPAERAELGRKILKQGQATGNAPAERFALLNLSRDVAVLADDDQLAFAAIDELGKAFEIDALSQKTEVLQTLTKTAKTLPAHKALCERALALGREAVDADKFSLADTLAKLAYAEAGKVRDKELVQRSRNLAKEQQEAAKSFTAVEEAFETLKKKPDDPTANLVAGKYSCFVKRDWSKGLKQLSKSGDAALKALADEERKVTPPEWEPAPGVLPPDPPSAVSALRLADAWWDLCQTATGTQRDQILMHAGYWYRQSFRSDTPSLVATKINNRVDQIEKIRAQYPPPPLAIAPFDAEAARQHQRRWADYLGVPWHMINSIGMKFVLIPPGEFMMGAEPEEIDWAIKAAGPLSESSAQSYSSLIRSEGPRHRVRITKPAYLGIYEVTQREYQAVMGRNPSAFSAQGKNNAKATGQDTNSHPVEMVSWDQATEFCHRLSVSSKDRALRKTHRLPTEAEWEYACRAGTTTKWYYGNESAGFYDAAWHKPSDMGGSRPVGQKKPNAWGLYDMYGHVEEWCIDWYQEDYYVSSPLVDPMGPPSGKLRTARNSGLSRSGRSASRCREINRSSENIGIRVLCEP